MVTTGASTTMRVSWDPPHRNLMSDCLHFFVNVLGKDITTLKRLLIRVP